MVIAYLAHPIGGDVEQNLASLGKLVREINMNYKNIVPFVPYYCDCLVLNDKDVHERNRGIQNNIAIIKSGMVNELWVCGPKISPGMEEEIKLAKKLNILVYNYSKNILQAEIDNL